MAAWQPFLSEQESPERNGKPAPVLHELTPATGSELSHPRPEGGGPLCTRQAQERGDVPSSAAAVRRRDSTRAETCLRSTGPSFCTLAIKIATSGSLASGVSSR